MKNEAEIRKLELLLKKPRTAAELSENMRCALVTVYARIGALKKVRKLRTFFVRQGRAGPKARAWQVD